MNPNFDLISLIPTFAEGEQPESKNEEQARPELPEAPTNEEEPKPVKEEGPANFGMSKQMTALLRREDEDDFNDDDPEKIIKVVVVGDGTSKRFILASHHC